MPGRGRAGRAGRGVRSELPVSRPRGRFVSVAGRRGSGKPVLDTQVKHPAKMLVVGGDAESQRAGDGCDHAIGRGMGVPLEWYRRPFCPCKKPLRPGPSWAGGASPLRVMPGRGLAILKWEEHPQV